MSLYVLRAGVRVLVSSVHVCLCTCIVLMPSVCANAFWRSWCLFGESLSAHCQHQAHAREAEKETEGEAEVERQRVKGRGGGSKAGGKS